MSFMIKQCLDCKKDLKRQNSCAKRCGSCAAKARPNPMLGRQHKNKEKFRKHTHKNVNYEDRRIGFSAGGNSTKRYRMTCIQCGFDRGYKRNIDALRVCKSCR